MKNWLKNITAILIGCFIAFVVGEIILRIYNPLPSRIRGNQIQLKANLKRKIVIDPLVKGLDKEINYSANSIGFRGIEPPKNFTDNFTVFVVGGSTTECSKLDDEKTWPQLLYYQLIENYDNVWLNNAGIDGCSTYGHLILLEDYLIKFKPNMILFLISVNDRGKASFGSEDGFLINRRESFFRTLMKKSEVANLINNLYETYKTVKVNLYHGAKADSTKDNISEEKQEKRRRVHKSYLTIYKKRVESLVNKCIANNITPVLITQPLLDDPTSLGWEIMQLYNKTTMEVADDNKILCIDLASKLEKKTANFYDNMHYTNEGAIMVAKIVFDDLIRYLQSNHINELGPTFATAP